MTITFKSILYNIKDSKGKLIKKLGIKDGQITREVFVKY